MVAGNLVHKLRSLMGGNAERVALTAKGVEQLRGQFQATAATGTRAGGSGSSASGCQAGYANRREIRRAGGQGQ